MRWPTKPGQGRENAFRANTPLYQCADEVESYIRKGATVRAIVNIILIYTIVFPLELS